MSAKARGIPEADVLAELSSTMPLGRLATDGDVAEVIAFFASDRAAGVTGQSILVNAGEFMQ
jgi:enoyl-[acyl-carrier-protein] reductase (NADH)